MVYDLDALKRGLVTIESNIKAIEKGLEDERIKKDEYEKHIFAAEQILRLHENGSKK